MDLPEPDTINYGFVLPKGILFTTEMGQVTKRIPQTFHQTIVRTKEWQAWKEHNDYPASRFDCAETEETGFFTMKHWNSFMKFLLIKYKKNAPPAHVKVNRYTDKAND